MRGLGKLGLFFLLFTIILTSIASLPEFTGVDHPGFGQNQVETVDKKSDEFQDMEQKETGLLDKVKSILGGSEVFNLAFTIVSTFSWVFGLITNLIGTATAVIDFVLVMPGDGTSIAKVIGLALSFVMTIGFIRVITGREF